MFLYEWNSIALLHYSSHPHPKQKVYIPFITQKDKEFKSVLYFFETGSSSFLLNDRIKYFIELNHCVLGIVLGTVLADPRKATMKISI